MSIRSDVSAQLADYVEKFKALADLTRVEIICLLRERGELCVCDLTEYLGGDQSRISYHLRILRDAGLIYRRTEGVWSYYGLNENVFRQILSPGCCAAFQPDHMATIESD